jgi:tetratricopeptide (TPR) repeat protein
MSHLRHPVAALVVVALVVTLGACSRPVDADKALETGLAQQRAGNLDAAAEQYQRVLDVRPTDKYANYNLGVIEQSSRPELAEGYYRAALADDPAFVPALFNLAILRTKVGATQEAIDLYLRVIEARSNYAAAYLNLGLLFRDAGQASKATRYLNEALALDPSLASRLGTEPVNPSPATAGGAGSSGATGSPTP